MKIARTHLATTLICLAWIMFAALSLGARLEWDYNPPSDGVTNYRVWVGTNSGRYVANYHVGRTNSFPISRLAIPRGKTNFFAVSAVNSFGEGDLSEEVYTNWALATIQPISNVMLRVPSGKFYVERSDVPTAWASFKTITGPTNISFATTGQMGFYRYRPYFTSVANPKSGATKLMATKQPMFKAAVKPIPIPPTTNAPPIIGPVNLNPSKI